MNQPRRFNDVFLELDKGEFHDRCSEALQMLVSRVEETHKVGKLTVQIEVKKKAGHNILVITPSLKVKEPEADVVGNLFYVSPDNNLYREDPRQYSMKPVIEHNPINTFHKETGEVING